MSNEKIIQTETRELRNAMGKINTTDFAAGGGYHAMDEFIDCLFDKLPDVIVDNFNGSSQETNLIYPSNFIYAHRPKNAKDTHSLQKAIEIQLNPEKVMSNCHACTQTAITNEQPILNNLGMVETNHSETHTYVNQQRNKYCLIYMHVKNRQFQLFEGNIVLQPADLTNFYVPGLNKNYEIIAISFLTAQAGRGSGHYFTYVKHENGWLNLNCLDIENREKVTLASSYVNNDFLQTMKVSYYGSTAYANMILLKAI
jgi:hypothetical protein